MPNNVQNRLIFIGANADIQNLKETIKGNESMGIDFNNITPMPEALNILPPVGVIEMVKNTLQLSDHPAPTVGDARRSKSPSTLNDADWDLFIACLHNHRRYGYMYWYDWSIENWSTKWNAYSNEESVERDTDNEIWFQTAWTTPVNVIKALSSMFPDVTIILEYADEDFGNNSGRIVFLDGKTISAEKFQDSAETRRFAFEMHNPGMSIEERRREWGFDENFNVVDG